MSANLDPCLDQCLDRGLAIGDTLLGLAPVRKELPAPRQLMAFGVALAFHAAMLALALRSIDRAEVGGGRPDVIEVSFEADATANPDFGLAAGPLQAAAEAHPDTPPPPPPPPPPVEHLLDTAGTVAAPPPPVVETAPPPPAPPALEPPAEATIASAPPAGAADAGAEALSAWQVSLIAHLEHFKRYPKGAKGINGTVRIAYTIDRAGHLLGASVALSSGSPVIDEEALATLKRADPFPAPPPGVAEAALSFVLPVRYKAR